MVRCDDCEHLIDSDDDPDCFIPFARQERFVQNYRDAVLCEWCRETLDAEAE